MMFDRMFIELYNKIAAIARKGQIRCWKVIFWAKKLTTLFQVIHNCQIIVIEYAEYYCIFWDGVGRFSTVSPAALALLLATFRTESIDWYAVLGFLCCVYFLYGVMEK